MSQTIAQPRRHRLTVSEYRRMGNAGILTPDARVELIDGAVIDMAPVGSSHVSAVLRLDRLFQDAEVAQSSIAFDRDEKIPLYARHGIAESWLVDIDAACLVRYRDPRREGYASVDTPDLGSPLEIAALPGARVHLGALFT